VRRQLLRRHATICGQDLHTTCSPRNTCPTFDSKTNALSLQSFELSPYLTRLPNLTRLAEKRIPARFHASADRLHADKARPVLNRNISPVLSSICFTGRSTSYFARTRYGLIHHSRCSLDGSNHCQDVAWVSWPATHAISALPARQRAGPRFFRRCRPGQGLDTKADFHKDDAQIGRRTRLLGRPHEYVRGASSLDESLERVNIDGGVNRVVDRT
jgi:hypothetical protein